MGVIWDREGYMIGRPACHPGVFGRRGWEEGRASLDPYSLTGGILQENRLKIINPESRRSPCFRTKSSSRMIFDRGMREKHAYRLRVFRAGTKKKKSLLLNCVLFEDDILSRMPTDRAHKPGEERAGTTGTARRAPTEGV